MLNQCLFRGIAVETNAARVRFFPRMQSLVLNEVPLLSKSSLTHTTHKRFLLGVHFPVPDKAVFVAKAFLAGTATIRHVTGVCFSVSGQ